MTDLREMMDAELREEEQRILPCLFRAEDLFSQMLLGERLKAIRREIYERPLRRIAE